MKSLRRLDGTESLPRQCLLYLIVGGYSLNGIGCMETGNRGALLPGPIQNSPHQIAIAQRPHGIVHQNNIHILPDMGDSVAYRFLSVRSSGNTLNFRLRRLIAQNGFCFLDMFEWQGNDYLDDFLQRCNSLHSVKQNRFAGDFKKLLRDGKTHALSNPSRSNDYGGRWTFMIWTFAPASHISD
jgi:hypothetical protein